MQIKNYYTTLRISPNSTSVEIKKAYRKLANQYHPDKNKGDVLSSEIFKEINIAYENLSDPEKRKKYDFSLSQNETFFDDSSQNNRGNDKEETEQDKNLPLHIKVNLKWTESRNGTIRSIKANVARFCPLCKGYGSLGKIICRECLGTGQKIEKKTFSVNIPASTFPGSTLRLKNAGHESRYHSQKGDVILDIEWEQGYWYMIDNELHTYHELTKREYKKQEFILKNFDNEKLSVKVPADIKEGQLLRIKDKGWIFDEYKSDLYIEIRFKKGNIFSKMLGFSF